MASLRDRDKNVGRKRTLSGKLSNHHCLQFYHLSSSKEGKSYQQADKMEAVVGARTMTLKMALQRQMISVSSRPAWPM